MVFHLPEELQKEYTGLTEDFQEALTLLEPDETMPVEPVYVKRIIDFLIHTIDYVIEEVDVAKSADWEAFLVNFVSEFSYNDQNYLELAEVSIRDIIAEGTALGEDEPPASQRLITMRQELLNARAFYEENPFL
jgi:hypothetical protein